VAIPTAASGEAREWRSKRVAKQESGEERGGEARVAHVVLTEPDPHLLKLLHGLLQRAGHTTKHVPNRPCLITLLQQSAAPLIVVLTSGALVGSRLVADASTEAILHSILACRLRPPVCHRALVLSASADLLPRPLLEQLARAEVPVVRKPFDVAHVLAAVTICTSHLGDGSTQQQRPQDEQREEELLQSGLTVVGQVGETIWERSQPCRQHP